MTLRPKYGVCDARLPVRLIGLELDFIAGVLLRAAEAVKGRVAAQCG